MDKKTINVIYPALIIIGVFLVSLCCGFYVGYDYAVKEAINDMEYKCSLEKLKNFDEDRQFWDVFENATMEHKDIR